MISKRTPEAGIQAHAVLPEGRLIVIYDAGEGDGVLDKGPVVPRFRAVFAVGANP